MAILRKVVLAWLLFLVAASSVSEARFPRGTHLSGLPPTGNVVLGLASPLYYEGNFPFLNVLKSADVTQITNSASPGVAYLSNIPQGATDVFGSLSPFGSGLYLDDNGDFLSSLPAGTITYSRLLFQVTGGGPANYITAPMTLDWSGGAAGWTVSITSSLGTLASGTGTTPLTFNWPTGSNQVSLVITGSGANPPTGLRLYRTASQALLNSGAVLDPDYRDSSKLGAWSIRFMDWMNTNSNLIATSISNFPAVANAGWTGGGVGLGAVNNNTAGIPLDVIIGTSREMNKHPWICIPEGFTTPKMRQIYSISRSSTPVVTTYGPHSFVNGDTVIIGTWSPFSGPLLLNPTSYSAGTFTTSGANSIANDTPVVLGKLLNGSSDSSTYPTGITKGTVYWTINATSTTFQLSATPGGSALSLSGSMTGTINVAENYQTGSTFGQLKILTSYASSTWTLNAHGMVDSTPIIFGVDTVFPVNNAATSYDSSIYPTGITKGVTYYVKNAATNTFQISASPGGTALTLTGSMTGTPHIYLQLGGNRFTVANATTSTFELTGPGANTAGYIGLSQRVPGIAAGVALAPFNLATIDSVVNGLASYVNSNLPTNLTPIYELANEWWNKQFTAGWTLESQIPDPTQYQNSFNYMGGYLMAATAHAVYKSYGASNRGRYKFVFSGNQTGNDVLGGSAGVVAGALQYLTDHGGGLTINDLFDFLTVTSYTAGASYGLNGSPVTATFGTNTIAFSGAVLGTPIKLNTDSPGGTLPTGLTAGTLGGSSYPSGSGQIYWLVGSGPNFGLATTPLGSPVSFTGGSGTNTATIAPTDVVQYLMAQSQALHISTPGTYPDEWSYFDTAIAQDVFDSRWTNSLVALGLPGAFSVTWNIGRYNYYTTNYTAVGKPLAGLPMIAYEGGESNNAVSGFPLFNDATWRAAYTYASWGAGSAANFMQIYTGAVQAGLLTHQAQFVDVSPLEFSPARGDFGARRYIGDNNPRWLGVVSVNSLN